MDFRRCYGLRAPRPIGYSTFMVPQLENYTLFATPYMDLNKKLSKLIKGFKQDVTDQSGPNITTGKGGKQKGKKEIEERKSEGDTQKSAEETSEVDLSFGIVLNVATVKPEELEITLGEGNEIEVSVKQKDAKTRTDINFSRNCSYKYQLPDGIDKNSLEALRTSDDYLIILPRDVLRPDLFEKAKKELAESSDNAGVTLAETEITDSKETKLKMCQDSKKPKPEGSGSKDNELKGSISEDAEESSKSESVFVSENLLAPVQVSRLLRPGMDIFILRKYMADFESYVSTVRKFIENASFITENSKTPELTLRAIATGETEKYLEKPRILKTEGEEKLAKGGSTESRISSIIPDASDESSRSSSCKSGEPTVDAREE